MFIQGAAGETGLIPVNMLKSPSRILHGHFQAHYWKCSPVKVSSGNEVPWHDLVGTSDQVSYIYTTLTGPHQIAPYHLIPTY